ncbi:MAG: hypothetical protein K5695_09055 [Oscillospiraceae bacterium]|nr:hypothetical protein [Oscillospiraceae bacterium]
MNTVTIIAIILLVLAFLACILMVYSIRGYHEKFKEMSKRNQMLAKKCSLVEQQLEVERQRKSPITGRSDSAELQELRRQIATLTRKGEEAERIQLEYNKCRERCRRLEAQLEAQQDAETAPSQAMQALEEELDQVKSQYGQLLEEYEQLQQTIGNEKAVVVDQASLSNELERVKAAYARLREEHEQLQQTIGDDKAAVLENAALSDELTRIKEAYAELLREKNELEESLAGGDGEGSEELTAELNRVKHAYAEQLQEQNRLRELLERARVELVALRGKLQESESANEELTARLQAAEQASAGAASRQSGSVAQDKYLALTLDPEQLETAGRIRFLNVLSMLDGSIKLSASTNIRLSELAMLQDGKVIPNPYFYRRFGTDGELGRDIQKIRQVMEFAEPDASRRYRLTALLPAEVEETNGTYRLVQKGELKLG